ncbi:MAG: peptidoglycan DD-metalloendopeptidase family protein [Deltaproteobacteria bacterium]
MKNKFYSIVILSNDASRPRQINLPLRVLRFSGVAAAVLFFLVAFVVIDYVGLKGIEAEVSGLRKENTEQRIELQGFSSRIRELDTQLARLVNFDKKLRIIANIDEPKAQAQEKVMGIGGRSSPEDEGYITTPGAKVAELSDEMRLDLRDLKSRADEQEASFNELQNELQRQSTMLSSTPSIWPAKGWVTSTFGQRISPFTNFPQMHKGMDIANRVGTVVITPAAGVVVEVNREAGLGKLVSISHGYGIKTTYGHLSETFVRVGQRVKRGDRIAAMGNTGHSTGPHLHYEVSVNGVNVNPNRYILN